MANSKSKAVKQVITPRETALTRNAQLRAKLTAFLNKSASYHTIAEIEEKMAATLTSLEITPVGLAAQLKEMAKNGLINSWLQGHKYVFWSLVGVGPAKPAQTFNEPKKEKVAKTVKAGMPFFQVDYVKSTKRVRITTADMIIEVGLVQ